MMNLASGKSDIVGPQPTSGTGECKSEDAEGRLYSETLVVLQSGPRPLPTTNPYNIMLARALEGSSSVDLRYFSWREALTRRHDVFHAHWPEALVDGRTPFRKLSRQVLFAALLMKWRFQGTGVVRTVHNLELPRDIGRREVWLLKAFERQTTVRICLNQHTPVPPSSARHIIPHGHYRSWYGDLLQSDPVLGRFVFFGMIRRYKGVDRLVEAFVQTKSEHPEWSLFVGGRPSTDDLSNELALRASKDTRVKLKLDFLQSDEMVAAVSQAELVVLPHLDMHNSGSALAALSLDRPVLVQDNEVNRDLRDEVGPGWVHLFEGDLVAEDLVASLDGLRADPPTARPNLDVRNWEATAALHYAAFHESTQR